MLSAGSWGTTLAKVFADAGSDVTIHARRPEVVAEINVRHQHARYLPEAVLPDRLRATVAPVEALAGRENRTSRPMNPRSAMAPSPAARRWAVSLSWRQAVRCGAG
ncbi:hypothetical protein [Streptomyces mirabilis]|uniref:hypothetical protein n=1 Tax=Streptomyces mirabilis TaxID=68239 RepID=UPI00324EA43C